MERVDRLGKRNLSGRVGSFFDFFQKDVSYDREKAKNMV